MAKTRVAVLRGGPSDEYHVSMQTGASVLAALADSGYEPIDIVISRSGEWLVHGFARTPQHALATTDVVFNGLHGVYGEDGTVQRLLDTLSIPYTGSGAYPSSLAMNKILTKEHLYESSIKMAPHMRITGDRNTDILRVVHMLEDMLGPECVVKPINGGSSIDTVITKGSLELQQALKNAFGSRTEVLVERRIKGREVTCGVVERFRDRSLYALPEIEIVIPDQHSFFTHDAKYSGKTDEICPGRFTHEQKSEIASYAALVHDTINLSQYSRSDFIVADDGIYFLEVNTLPGLTPESLVPKALEAIGCSYKHFVSHLVEDALCGKR